MIRFSLPLALLVCTLVLLPACDSVGGGPTATATPSRGATPVAGASQPSPAPASSPAPTTVVANDEPVAFQAADGITLRGHLYSASGPRRKVLIVVSSLEQRTWRLYAAELAGRGVALLTFDLRGVGETGGSRNDALSAGDIALAAGFLRSREYPQVYLFGAGAPAATAVFAAAATEAVAGVAALPAGGASPQQLQRITAPKLYLAFESDSESVAAINRAVQAAPEPNTRVIVPGPSAADVLSVPIVRQALLDFVTK